MGYTFYQMVRFSSINSTYVHISPQRFLQAIYLITKGSKGHPRAKNVHWHVFFSAAMMMQ